MKTALGIIISFLFLSCSNDSKSQEADIHVNGRSQQVLLVEVSQNQISKANLYLMEKIDGKWRKVDTILAIIGRNGLAPEFTDDGGSGKKEGDGKSPSGNFPLLFAFGYAKDYPTKLPYRQMQEADICIDNIGHPNYNQHMTVASDPDYSHEKMRRQDGLYELGIWVGYNTEPTISGDGSCIFLHIWKDSSTPTSGCTAMSKEDMERVLRWIVPEKNPVLIQKIKE
jgi:L,D-peptidoglycan transpeptidase YkuD (ErfK/YbiS/YcfS/YnhG family)